MTIMISLEIPGRGKLEIKYAAFDVNGTLAVDGRLVDGIRTPFRKLRDKLEVYLLTADTHGKQKDIDQLLSTQATIIQRGEEAEQKAAFVNNLGSQHVAAIGQGANDAQMLDKAAIGICVLSKEGTALETLLNADILVPDILSGLALLENPLRLVASLRK
ncbi:MAG: hypothetical protein KGY39_01900 [Anaerolineales bacterium]|nr:hypothetical protein [Anaerolineales bacterium]MBS3753222.1 hypothetical protein [Anaerolineales bacterium]